ncbi:MAG: outer membrane protein assembly factor BamD, partial [Burkholderiales bacterium]
MKHSLALILALLLSGCSWFENKEDPANLSASKLFSDAMEDMDDSNYEQAIKKFETLESRYPYGRYAEQAQLEVAYAYYKQEDVPSATAACDRFIKLHPTHPNVDYAYYLKGLANFNENLGIIAKLGGQDITERDPKQARESYDAFRELLIRFPNSKYVEDSAARARFLLNGLANYELQVARYYMKRKAYVAAVNRAQYVVKNYQQTPSTEQALLIMIQAYDALGMTDLRNDAESVMKHNFPNSKYLSGSADSG